MSTDKSEFVHVGWEQYFVEKIHLRDTWQF